MKPSYRQPKQPGCNPFDARHDGQTSRDIFNSSLPLLARRIKSADRCSHSASGISAEYFCTLLKLQIGIIDMIGTVSIADAGVQDYRSESPGVRLLESILRNSAGIRYPNTQKIIAFSRKALHWTDQQTPRSDIEREISGIVDGWSSPDVAGAARSVETSTGGVSHNRCGKRERTAPELLRLALRAYRRPQLQESLLGQFGAACVELELSSEQRVILRRTVARWCIFLAPSFAQIIHEMFAASLDDGSKCLVVDPSHNQTSPHQSKLTNTIRLEAAPATTKKHDLWEAVNTLMNLAPFNEIGCTLLMRLAADLRNNVRIADIELICGIKFILLNLQFNLFKMRSAINQKDMLREEQFGAHWVNHWFPVWQMMASSLFARNPRQHTAANTAAVLATQYKLVNELRLISPEEFDNDAYLPNWLGHFEKPFLASRALSISDLDGEKIQIASNRNPEFVVLAPAFKSGSSWKDDQGELNRMLPLATPMPRLTMPSASAIETARNELLTEFPWAREAIEQMVGDLWLRRTCGAIVAGMHPTLLVGAPGCGKTRLARRLAEVMCWPNLRLSIDGDSKVLSGTARGWASARSGRVPQFLAERRTAGALVIVDEVDKTSGSGTRVRDDNTASMLLQLLEPENSRTWYDSFMQCPIDLSGVMYVLTANRLSTLAQPLLSRLRVIHVPSPDVGHMQAIAEATLRDIASDWGMPAQALPQLPELNFTGVSTPRQVRGLVMHWLKGWAAGSRTIMH